MDQFQLTPEQCEKINSKLLPFLTHNLSVDRIVLVTAGGTTVPLEQNMVRFLDNFSAGTRGSASAEYFLRQGCAVIFLHRANCIQPFSRHLKVTASDMMDMLQLCPDGSVKVDMKAYPVDQVVAEYKKYKTMGRLLKIDFTTLTSYLAALKHICAKLNAFGSRCMIYLAAAVSDFYIPTESLPKHKIQSADGDLNLHLQLVPKLLKPLVQNLVPQAFVISFKLETDFSLLIPKSQASLKNYGHQLVIGNILTTRKREVWLVNAQNVEHIVVDPDKCEIESKIVEELIKLHTKFLNQK